MDLCDSYQFKSYFKRFFQFYSESYTQNRDGQPGDLVSRRFAPIKTSFIYSYFYFILKSLVSILFTMILFPRLGVKPKTITLIQTLFYCATMAFYIFFLSFTLFSAGKKQYIVFLNQYKDTPFFTFHPKTLRVNWWNSTLRFAYYSVNMK